MDVCGGTRASRFRLVAVIQFWWTDDRFYLKQLLQRFFPVVPFYTLKQSEDCDGIRVTAIAFAELVLSAHCALLSPDYMPNFF